MNKVSLVFFLSSFVSLTFGAIALYFRTIIEDEREHLIKNHNEIYANDFIIFLDQYLKTKISIL